MGETAHPGPADLSSPLLLWRYRTERRCPECGSHDVARSRRHGLLEALLQLLLRLRPYRCRHCAGRYFGYTHAARVASCRYQDAA